MMWQKQYSLGPIRTGLQERDLHFQVPEDPQTNPVTSSSPLIPPVQEKRSEEEVEEEGGKVRRRENSNSMRGSRAGEKDGESDGRKAKLQESGGRKTFL